MKFPSFSITKEIKELKKFESLKKSDLDIVFYAENIASMNHFQLLIDELTEKMNLQICYVTSVEDDPIFNLKNKNIKSFYIGDGAIRTKFFLTLRAKILIMDMPDLESFHIKRSKISPVHYIYIFHSMFSVHSYLRKGAVDNYDTIFCVGPHHVSEIKEIEKKYNLKPKALVNYGFGRLDTLMKKKQEYPTKTNSAKLIIIAPTYGKENLLEKCGLELISLLLKLNYQILLRPHFRILKDSKKLIESIKQNFKNNPNFIFETGVIPFDLFNKSFCMISDWSGISFEYAFTHERPVIFIDVPKKILNSHANEISLIPIEISIRNKIGYVVDPNKLELIPKILSEINENTQNFSEQILQLRSQVVFNVGKSAEIGAKYIEQLKNKL